MALTQQQAYIPQQSSVTAQGGRISDDYNRSCLRPLVATQNALATAVFLQGPFADPNGDVVASPGAIYTYSGGGANVTLWIKESGVNTDTGWTAK